tara:strand:- start:32 stop:688 length:657 start_codon:yes stop_codon:yes gene_type:complete
MLASAPDAEEWLETGLAESSKITAVANHIWRLGQESGRKTRKLVFCHFKGEIDALASALGARGITVDSLDGRTSPEDRKKLLNGKAKQDVDFGSLVLHERGLPAELVRGIIAYLSGPEVLILQIQTGCEGLNLQSFSDVYFVSPHWNPAVEDQAIARCHRLGQDKPVRVFRFTMTGFDPEATTISLDRYSKRVQLDKRVEAAELDAETRVSEREEVSE